jgi:hypothetical protein
MDTPILIKDIPTLIRLFKEGKIREGDTITVYGFQPERRVSCPIPPPYYFSAEEKRGYITYMYSHQGLSDADSEYVEWIKHHLSDYLRDDYGYYYYNTLFLFSGDSKDITIYESGEEYPCAVHLIPFGLDYPHLEFTGHSYEEYGCDYYVVGDDYYHYALRVTGQIFIPKNVSECRLELGIGNLSAFQQVYRTVLGEGVSYLPSPYDPRPQIDFSMFPKESHKQRIQDVLTETGMKREDFNFIFEK